MYSKKDRSASKGSIRIGLVGHMFMGVAHSNAYRNAGIWYDVPAEIVMKAVCAKDSEENLNAFARKFGWEETEDDWRRLVSRPDIDVVSVAVPGNLHKSIVVEAARQGKHVLCEKPLANSLGDAVEMLAEVQKAGVRHCCGFSYRSTPATALAARWVAEGRLGQIYHVYARYAQDWPSTPEFPMTWRFDRQVAGSGALGDLAAHSIDLAHFITSLEFSEVCANLQTFIHERSLPTGERAKVTVDDAAQFLCKFDNGATGCFEATRMAVGRKNQNRIEVNGSKGSLYWDFEEQDYLYYYDRCLPAPEQGFTKINATHDQHPYGGGPWPQGHGIGYADTFVIEIANFLRSVVENQEFHPDFGDGVKVQRVLAAVERSAAERRWVRVEEV